jgi:hypothetical protein
MKLGLLFVVGVAAQQSCSQDKDVVYGTGEVKQLTAKAVDDCCQACYDYGYNCKAFTFQPSTGACFLKDNTNGQKAESDRISGKPSSTPGPPTGQNKTTETRACLPGV